MVYPKGYWKVTFKNNGRTSPIIAHVYADTEADAVKKGMSAHRNRNGSDYGFDWSKTEDVIEKVECLNPEELPHPDTAEA